MTLNDFESLIYKDQLHYWLDEGRYLAVRFVGSYVIKLYAVDSFFVEAWHGTEFNQLEQLESFSSGYQLDVYLASITLVI